MKISPGNIIDITIVIIALVLIIGFVYMDEYKIQNNADRFGGIFVVIALIGIIVYQLKNLKS